MIDSGVSGFSRDEKVQNLPASRSSSELSAHQMAPAGVSHRAYELNMPESSRTSSHRQSQAGHGLRRCQAVKNEIHRGPLYVPDSLPQSVASCMSYSFADQVLAQLDLLKQHSPDVPQGPFKDGGAFAWSRRALEPPPESSCGSGLTRRIKPSSTSSIAVQSSVAPTLTEELPQRVAGYDCVNNATVREGQGMAAKQVGGPLLSDAQKPWGGAPLARSDGTAGYLPSGTVGQWQTVLWQWWNERRGGDPKTDQVTQGAVSERPWLATHGDRVERGATDKRNV